MITKICIQCKRELLLIEFNRHKSCKFGVDSKCKKCISDNAKIYYKIRKDRGYYSIGWEERQRDEGELISIPRFKICKECGKELLITDFYKSKTGMFGLSSKCKDCDKKRYNLYYRTEKCQSRIKGWTEQQHIERKNQDIKLCTGCNRELPLDQFFNKTNGKFGVEVLCKKCKHKKNEKYHHTDKGREAGKRAWNKRRVLVGIVSTLTDDEWKEIKKQYNFRCVYCGEKKPLTQDHLIPISKGGHHVKENIIPACQSCNSKKGNKTVLLQLLALVS